jgi:hypothetical protein
VAVLLCPILIVAEPVTAEVRLPAASADEQRLARIEHREHADKALDEDERVVVAHHPPARATPRLAPVHDHKQLEHLMREAIRGHHQRSSSEVIIRGRHQRPSSEAIIRGHHQRPSSEHVLVSTFWAIYGEREPGVSSLADSGSAETYPVALSAIWNSAKIRCRAPWSANVRLATRARDASSLLVVSTPKKTSSLLSGAAAGGHGGHEASRECLQYAPTPWK